MLKYSVIWRSEKMAQLIRELALSSRAAHLIPSILQQSVIPIIRDLQLFFDLLRWYHTCRQDTDIYSR